MKEKLKSRKFVVWITATILLLLSFIAYVIVKDSTMAEVIKIFAESWGWVSALYIGGNVVQKFVGEKTE